MPPVIERHRPTIRDALLVMGIILVVGYLAFAFTLIGSVPGDKRISFEEALALGMLIFVGVLYLSWRRVYAQECENKRRIAAERRAHELANTDPLTGLANRRGFESTLAAAISDPLAVDEAHAVLMLDLNDFKKINDVYGHVEGDDVLVATAGRLLSVLRGRDLVARMGGDEFAIVAHHVAGPEGATNMGLRILKEFESPVLIGGHRHSIGISIGIALVPRDAQVAQEIVRKADIALYRAKAEGRSAMRFFEEEMDAFVRVRDVIERELAAAIGTNALRPWYQPFVDLKSGDVIGFEALARWRHSTLGEVPPQRFIPVAEECGLIHKLSDWLLRCAASDAQRWPKNTLLSFNVSAVQLKDRAFGPRVLSILSETGLAPDRLEIELTESAMVRDPEAVREVLTFLHNAGIRIALDDFGTGYSTLYHLCSFRPSKIKIDRSFVHAMSQQRESAAIVKALTGLGTGLGLIVTAEGIEESSEREALVRLGCQQGQGYLFSRAVPAADTAAFFRSGPEPKQRALAS